MSHHVNAFVLKKGMSAINKDISNSIKSWQTFLLSYFKEQGKNVDDLIVDGIFGDVTEKYTIEFQTEHSLTPDGIVGNVTVSKAIFYGYGNFVDVNIDKNGPSWPERPHGLSLLNVAQKHKLFGRMEYVRDLDGHSRESIKITNDWQKKYLTKVTVSQLKGIKGASNSCEVFCNKIVANPLIELWNEWENEGLLDRVLTWSGMWVPRLVRGSSTTLSSHAWGTAFDINSAWNMLGCQPALVGEKGSVRELVPIAVKHGFYWGAWMKSNNRVRQDGMHFEYCRSV